MVRLQSCRAGNLECFQCLDLLRYLGEREGDRELERERERYLLGLLLLLELLLYRRLLGGDRLRLLLRLRRLYRPTSASFSCLCRSCSRFFAISAAVSFLICLLSCLLIILLSLSCGVSFFSVWGVLPVTPEAPLLSLASAADVLLT